MKYKLTCEVTEDQMIKLMPMTKKIIPLYKSKAEATDINWIHENKDIIVDAACEYIWDKYYNDFYDHKILSKKKLFKTIRDELDIICKTVRINENTVQYCFVESKSTS